MIGKAACTSSDPLAKQTLLGILWKPGLDEVQTLEILPTNRLMPNGGWFTIKIRNRVTTSIYFSENASTNAANLNRAINCITSTHIDTISYSQFLVTFKDAYGQQNIPLMQLQENSLTYNEEINTGTVRITTKTEGANAGYGYALLRSIPLSSWNIVAFDAKKRTACVEIYTNSGWVKKTNGDLERSPSHLSLTFSPII